jgi:uncharacterized lipoprotein YehR (DUF1307 family)
MQNYKTSKVLLESAEFSIDGKKLKFDNSDEAFTIFDPRNGGFYNLH